MKPYSVLPLMFVFMLGTGVSQKPRQEMPVTLIGRVSDWQGCLLKDVTIRVTDTSGKTLGTATTSEMGEYRFTGLPAGSATLRADTPGFSRSESHQILAAGQNVWDTGLSLGRIAPGGSHLIRGRVLTTEQMPLSNATVSLLSAFESALVEQVRTNAAGEYTLTAYDPGQYILTAVQCGFEVTASSAVFPFDDEAGTTVNFQLRKGRQCP